MAVARPIRMLSAACVVLVIFLVFQMNRGPSYVGTGSGPYNGMQVDPLKEITGEPEGYLWRADEHDYAPDSTDSARTNAAIISLVRNEELDDLIPSIRDLERTWNHKFNYPWIFFNDKPFTEEFKKRTRAEIKARVQFELIPADHWAVPKWIDMDLFKDAAEELKEKGLQYADKISYHQMCRWNSGMFYKHPALETYRYYWRVEPKVQFFCDVDYDVFRFMEDRNQTYGFTINLFDAPESIPSLWPTTQEFLAANPSYLSENNMMAWLTDDQLRPDHTREANGYSTCHFWSNFEIGDMDFFRGDKYSAYFDYLDKAGGFFYERWGDAPVHSIGLGLLEDASKVHWFRDIGYRHIPYFNCPNSPKCSACTPGKFYDGEPFLAKEDCRPSYFKHVGTH